MTDETDKLAAQMRNLKPTSKSRNAGLDAAMAAFSAEFGAETSSEAVTSEKNSTSVQGSTAQPRPTGNPTKTVRVKTRRVETMSKFNSIFQKPQAMMMAGTCGAALIAALVVLPNMDELTEELPSEVAAAVEETTDLEDSTTTPESISVPETEEDETIIVTGSRAVLKKQITETPAAIDVITAEDLGHLPEPNLAEPSETVPDVSNQSKPTGGINSVDALLKDIQSRPRSAQVEREFHSAPPPPQIQIAPGFGEAQTGRTRIVLQNSTDSTPRVEAFGGLTLEEVPAEYEVETKEIVTKDATTELVTIPPTYETIAEPIVVQEGSTELVTIPPTYNADGTVATPAKVVERTVPAVTKTETRRVMKTPAATVEREIPAGTKRKVQVRTEITPQRFYLRDDDGNIVREFDSRDAFEKYKLNTTTAVSEVPVSTFSVDVDTASYSFLRASINRGQLPPRESIRLEEMINYFPYDYEAPKSAQEPFKANVTVTQNPWNADTKLMHIGIKGYVPKQAEKPRSNLVFLIDTSGSMNQPNKLPLLVNSFKLLLNSLDEDDTVSIVAYASASGTVLEPTAVKNKAEILNALNNLRAGGSTAGAAGLELAYQKAQESFDDEGVNRVILATDGDFNVGFSSPDDMKDFIKEKRETGIFLSVLGFGVGNYNDYLMQSLAQNGNGVAAYIDTLSEANKVLANEAGSALFTIAKDVKIQVEFNPATVAEYRLIGYETRALKRQDFNNDKVDAGEIGAGHSVTAIYEMTPIGSPAITIDKLRYASVEGEPKNTGSDEYAFVKIRHKLPDADKSTLQTFPIGKRQERRLNRASDDMRFATAVSIVGQKLRGDMQVEDYSYADAIKLAQDAKGEDDHGYRAEFIQMVKLIEAMGE